MSTNAAYASTPRYELAVASVGAPAWDGTGTIVPLFTAGDNGSRIDTIAWAAQGNTTAGFLKFFVRESSQDSWRYFICTQVEAKSVSATSFAWIGSFQNLNFILKAGAQIGFAPHNNEEFIAHVTNAGDF